MTRAALCCLLLALTGCTSFAYPLLGRTATPFDQRLVGRWEGQFEEDDRVQLVIRRDGRVDMTTQDPDSVPEKVSFRLRVARVDGFDVANVAMKDHGKTFWQPMRYEITDSRELRVFMCNDDLWFDAVSRGELPGNASRGQHGPSTFVSAPRRTLLEFVEAHHGSVFVDEPLVLRKTR